MNKQALMDDNNTTATRGRQDKDGGEPMGNCFLPAAICSHQLRLVNENELTPYPPS
jgi:hypothetical protein